METVILVIAYSFGVLLLTMFLRFIVSELIENYKFKKDMMQVYISYNETKSIHRKDYYMYEKADKEIREKHKKYNDWFMNLDDDRKFVYLLERRGFYYESGLLGGYIKDYINCKIDKEQFDKCLDAELDSEEYNNRIKERRLLLKVNKDELRKQLLQRKIVDKSKELAELQDEYSKL